MTPPPGEPFWIEHKSPEGKAYYSNPITHETTWQRPANVLVRPGPPFVTPTSQAFTPTSQPSSPSTPPQLPFPQTTGGTLLVPTKVWSEHKNSEGKVYFYNKITLQSVWEKPKDFDLILPMPVAMASTGPANDASTGVPAATGAGGSEGEAQKEDGGQQQQQENGDASQQVSNSVTTDQPPPIGLPPSDGDAAAEPKNDDAIPSDTKVERMDTESVPPTITTTVSATSYIYSYTVLFIVNLIYTVQHKTLAEENFGGFGTARKLVEKILVADHTI